MPLTDIYVHPVPEPDDLDTRREYSDVQGHELPPGTTRDEFRDILEHASLEFWATIADRFPEVKTGDFGPEESCAWEIAMEDAVGTWLMWNHPAADPWGTMRSGRKMAEAAGHDWDSMSEARKRHWGEEAWAELNANAVK